MDAIIKFLLGEDTFEDNWFGVPKNGQMFWWRTNLRQEYKALTTRIQELERENKMLEKVATRAQDNQESLQSDLNKLREELRKEDKEILSMLKDVQSVKNKHYFLRLFADGSGTVNNCGDKKDVFTYDSITGLKQFLKDEAQ